MKILYNSDYLEIHHALAKWFIPPFCLYHGFVNNYSMADICQKLLTDIGHGVIVNEAMVKAKGWDEPLGQRVMNFQVIGVVKDFHFVSLHSPVEPLGMIRLSDSNLQPI